MRAVQACLLLSLVAASPAAAAVSNATVERVSPEMVVVRWSDAAPVDVLVADKPDVAPSVAILASKDDRDGMHQLAAPTSQRLYVTLRDTRDGTVVKVAERLLPLAQSSNFRDIGGYAAAGGKHVRWGKIYRSGATPLLTDADLQEIKALGLANMVDLRSSEEVVLVPTRIRGVPMTSVGYSMGQMMSLDPAKLGTSNGPELYGTFPVFLAPQLRVVFERLLSNDGPLVYNCSAGQDRTGFVTAMVLSALGVPRATIIEDYHLSTAYRRRSSRRSRSMWRRIPTIRWPPCSRAPPTRRPRRASRARWPPPRADRSWTAPSPPSMRVGDRSTPICARRSA